MKILITVLVVISVICLTGCEGQKPSRLQVIYDYGSEHVIATNGPSGLELP
jgi:hypothetical protein